MLVYEWGRYVMLDDAKMTTALLDRLTHREIVETGTIQALLLSQLKPKSNQPRLIRVCNPEQLRQIGRYACADRFIWSAYGK